MKKNFKFSNTGNAFLLAFGMYYAASIAYQLILTRFYGNASQWPVAAQWCNYLLNPVVFIGVSLIYAKKKDVNIVSAAKLKGKITIRQVGIIALLSIFCIMAFLPISNIFLDLLSRLGFNLNLSFADTSASVGAYFLGLLMLAVMPALSEEFLMRGVVLNAAEQRRDFSYAILITAGMFSLMHGNPIQTVHQFMLGMTLAYIVLVSRSIWAGVLLHLFNNFLSLTLDYPYVWFMKATGAQYMPTVYRYLIWIVCIILGGTIVVYLLKKFTDISRDKTKMPDTEIIDMVENGDGVLVAESGNGKARLKAGKNDFVMSFKAICGIFKKNGFRHAYNRVNTIICDIVPDESSENIQLTREDMFPANIKLAYVILAVIWIASLVMGFVS